MRSARVAGTQSRVVGRCRHHPAVKAAAPASRSTTAAVSSAVALAPVAASSAPPPAGGVVTAADGDRDRGLRQTRLRTTHPIARVVVLALPRPAGTCSSSDRSAGSCWPRGAPLPTAASRKATPPTGGPATSSPTPSQQTPRTRACSPPRAEAARFAELTGADGSAAAVGVLYHQ